jgi:hypothetical protein
MRNLILANSRFKNMQHPIVSRLKGSGSGNAGHGGYVKKDYADEGKGTEGTGMSVGIVKKKLKPLKFKM